MVTRISDKTSSDVISSAENNWIVDLIDGTGVSNARLKWAQTDTTGSALSITRNLSSTSTDSPVVSFGQSNVSDDQVTVSISQAGTGRALTIISSNTTDGYPIVRFDDNKYGAGNNQVAFCAPKGNSIYAGRTQVATQPVTKFENLEVTDNNSVLVINQQGTATAVDILACSNTNLTIRRDSNSNFGIDFAGNAATPYAMHFYPNFISSAAGNSIVPNSKGTFTIQGYFRIGVGAGTYYVPYGDIV